MVFDTIFFRSWLWALLEVEMKLENMSGWEGDNTVMFHFINKVAIGISIDPDIIKSKFDNKKIRFLHINDEITINKDQVAFIAYRKTSKETK